MSKIAHYPKTSGKFGWLAARGSNDSKVAPYCQFARFLVRSNYGAGPGPQSAHIPGENVRARILAGSKKAPLKFAPLAASIN